MTHTPTDPRSGPAEPASHRAEPAPTVAAVPQYLDADHPRLVEEHHIVGPYGEDELEATDERGRRWYHLRPEPRRRVDLIGFNYTWWLIWLVFMLIIFLPWRNGWGY
jgi:hypothetical protein